MAVEADFAYLRHLIQEGLVVGPVLEIGSRAWQGEQGNTATECRRFGLKWEGTDIEAGAGVNFVLDILDTTAVVAVGRQWPSVLVFNLLEHVYDPIAALRNAMSLVAPGGVAVVVGPAIWQLHDYPRDYWRPMPDFFVEFAEREGYSVVREAMMWTVLGRLVAVDQLSIGSQKKLPSISLSRRRGRLGPAEGVLVEGGASAAENAGAGHAVPGHGARCRTQEARDLVRLVLTGVTISDPQARRDSAGDRRLSLVAITVAEAVAATHWAGVNHRHA